MYSNDVKQDKKNEDQIPI